MIATVSGTQYDRCSGSTSLSTAATAVQDISRIVNVQAIRPPTSWSATVAAPARRGPRPPVRRTGAEPDGRPVPGHDPDSPTMESRSASAPGLADHGGGMSGSSAAPLGPTRDRVGEPVDGVGDPRRRPLARGAQRGRRLGHLVAGVEDGHQVHVPPLRPLEEDRTVSSAS